MDCAQVLGHQVRVARFTRVDPSVGPTAASQALNSRSAWVHLCCTTQLKRILWLESCHRLPMAIGGGSLVNCCGVLPTRSRGSSCGSSYVTRFFNSAEMCSRIFLSIPATSLITNV